jgi:prepilin-type processing-associated H-X9-DG protein
MNSARTPRGFTVPELLIVVFSLAVFAFLLVPVTFRRHTHCRINCVNNLKQVGLSFRTFALDNNDKFPMRLSVTNGGTLELVSSGWVYPHFQVMSNELSTPRVLICPEDKFHTNAANFGSGFRNQNISYFVGPDSVDTQPQMLLSGDSDLLVAGQTLKRGLAEIWTNSSVAWSTNRHVKRGNLGFADGSVQQVSSRQLGECLQTTGGATNRLLMP